MFFTCHINDILRISLQSMPPKSTSRPENAVKPVSESTQAGTEPTIAVREESTPVPKLSRAVNARLDPSLALKVGMKFFNDGLPAVPAFAARQKLEPRFVKRCIKVAAAITYGSVAREDLKDRREAKRQLTEEQIVALTRKVRFSFSQLVHTGHIRLLRI